MLLDRGAFHLEAQHARLCDDPDDLLLTFHLRRSNMRYPFCCSFCFFGFVPFIYVVAR